MTNSRVLYIEYLQIKLVQEYLLHAFSPRLKASSKLYGPMKELLSEENPPRYRETTVADYVACFRAKRREGTSAFTHYMI